jgi:hypothetical protein
MHRHQVLQAAAIAVAAALAVAADAEGAACPAGVTPFAHLPWPAVETHAHQKKESTSCRNLAEPEVLARLAGPVVEREVDARLRAAASAWARVETFVVFIATARSGHTLIGSLIDAHPDAVVANEADILGKFLDRRRHPAPDGQFASRDSIFAHLVSNSMRCGMVGRMQTGYNYSVPGMWNGQWRCGIRVLGDKKGAAMAEEIQNDRLGATAFFEALRVERVAVVFVSPSTLDDTSERRRRAKAGSKSVPTTQTELAVRALISAVPDATAVEVFRLVDFACHPRVLLVDLLRFLGLEPYPEFVDASVKLVDPRFCHHTGNRTVGERKGSVFYAGNGSNEVNRNRLRTRP